MQVPRTWFLFAGAVVALISGASVVTAAGTAPVAPWEEAAGLEVMSADTLDAHGRIFDSPDYQQQLIVPGAGTDAFLLALKTKTVRILPQASITWTDDEPVPDVASGADTGTFDSDNGVVSFAAKGIAWKIEPEPPLVGPVTLEKLVGEKPDYQYAADRYTPMPEAIQALKGLSADTHIVIFFGSWCTFCKHWLPRFLKTMEETGNPKITTEFYGISEDQTQPKDVIDQYRVVKTPTFVIEQGDKEIGRIEEEPSVSIEADLVKILDLH